MLARVTWFVLTAIQGFALYVVVRSMVQLVPVQGAAEPYPDRADLSDALLIGLICMGVVSVLIIFMIIDGVRKRNWRT